MWKPIPEWPQYEVSDQGEVRSVTRTVHIKNPYGVVKPRVYAGRTVKLPTMKSGYQMAHLSAPGRAKRHAYVHALVLEVFVGPVPEGMECCHNNGVRADNRLVNLRYDTRSANALDRHAHGTMPKWRGVECPIAKLDDEGVRYIRANTGVLTQRAMGKTLGVCHRTVGSVIRGESWSHVA